MLRRQKAVAETGEEIKRSKLNCAFREGYRTISTDKQVNADKIYLNRFLSHNRNGLTDGNNVTWKRDLPRRGDVSHLASLYFS